MEKDFKIYTLKHKCHGSHKEHSSVRAFAPESKREREKKR